MEYSKNYSSLVQGRVEVLEADLIWIVENADFSSFEGFRMFWKEKCLSMIHHAVRPKENKDEFYWAVYQVLTELIKTSLELAVKSIYVLFTIYFTQHRRPVLIPITPEVAEIIQKITQMNPTCKNLIGKLSSSSAFDFCMAEGVKSFTRPKKSHSTSTEKSKQKPQINEKILSQIAFDHDSLHAQSIHYTCSKEKLKEKIESNLNFFKDECLPSNTIAINFKAQNTKMLSLSNPLFPDLISSHFYIVDKYIKKLEPEDLFDYE